MSLMILQAKELQRWHERKWRNRKHSKTK